MNTVDFGYKRQLSIRALLLQFPYIYTSVLQRLFFAMPSGKRKCRQVLQRMVEKGIIRRFKHGYEYVYYCGNKSVQWYHIHCVSMFHFELLFSLRKPQEIVYCKHEFEYSGGRADALYYVKLREDGGGIKFFLEWDDGKNYWDKFGKYEEYAKSRAWLKESWADPLKTGRPSFPAVLVITERELQLPEAGLLRVKICKPGENYLGVLLDGK